MKKSKALTPEASMNLSYTVISNQTQPTTTNYIANSDTKRAEIRWILKCVTSSFSNNSCWKLNDLFCADKIRYAVNFEIAPYFRSLLVYEIKKTLKFRHVKWTL